VLTLRDSPAEAAMRSEVRNWAARELPDQLRWRDDFASLLVVDRLLSRLDLNLGERRTGASRALRLGTEQLADMPAQLTDGVGERCGRLLGPVDDVTRCAHRQNLGSRRLKS